MFALPSLRFGKLRLYELTIVFFADGSMSVRSHWPMHGPQALASTVAPMASRSASRPSRSIVARTCSEPGVTSSWVFAVRPFADAWRAIDAARVMSSYEEFVHEPMSADDTFSGQSFAFAAAPISLTLWARSGVCGPLISGSSVDEVDLDDTVEEAARVGLDLGIGPQVGGDALAASAIASRPVAFR